MKKRLALILSAAVMMEAVCACGQGSGESQPASGSGDGVSSAPSSAANAIFNGELEENVTIQVLENDTAISKGYFDELIKAFNDAYADKGIKAVDANMDQYLDLANDGPYGYGPDVLYQANDIIMQYADGKHIYPLPVETLECYDQIPQSAWDAYKLVKDGQTYYCGVPVNVQTGMLYYRRDLLPDNWETEWDDNSNGIPDMAENWNDMYAFSKERHSKDSSHYGYMKSLYDVYFSSGYLFSYGGYVFGQNNTDSSDIGFSKGESEKGAGVLKQLASVMTEECIDETITNNCSSKLADGTYFATVTTPDMYTTFYDDIVKEYVADGQSEEDAKAAATENLVMTTLPALPASGDLTEDSPELIPMKSMGGVNGYGISAYTKCPNACLEFVKFATSYEMVMKRAQILGIAPARGDAAGDAGETSSLLYQGLADGNIVLMPSCQEVAQIWTPGQTFFSDLAKDAFRPEGQEVYKTTDDMKKGLEKVDQQIYDAIYTLK